MELLFGVQVHVWFVVQLYVPVMYCIRYTLLHVSLCTLIQV